MELIKALLAQEGLASASEEGIRRRPAGEPAGLSFAQERLWFFGRMAPDSPVFNIPALYRVVGPLEPERLERAFAEVVARHETLRTGFGVEQGRVVQRVAETLDDDLLRIPVEDLHGQGEAAALERARAFTRLPFDLEAAPLARLALYRLGDEEHLLALSIHHIVSEVQSLGVLMGDLARGYAGESAALPELEIQFADFAAWQRGRLEGSRLDDQLAWWTERLGGELPTLELPTDRPRPATQSFAGGTATRAFSASTAEALRAFCRREKVTPFAAALAVWGALLSRYGGDDDVLVGVPVTDRNRSELTGLIGFFVNTLVIRCDLRGDPGFGELVRRVRDFQLGAQSNQELPFERLVEELEVERDLSRSPIFNVAFLYQTAGEGGAAESGLELGPATRLAALEDPLAVHTQTSKFDASLVIWDRPEGISASIEYASDLFDAATIERMLGHLERLLEGGLADPERPLASFGILGPEEERLILGEWNATDAELREDVCVDALFEEQVDRTPDAIAVAFGDSHLTYRELDERANQLAHRLRELGVGPDDTVAVATERCLEMLVGILGTLKAGGAYLPIDLAYPAERLGYVFEDAGVKVVLTRAPLEPSLPGPERCAAPRLRLDADAEQIDACNRARPERRSTSKNLAYVIYTSGSTGKPKGVDLEHTGLVNLLTWHRRAFDVKASDRATHLAGLAFDASVWEVWPYLTAGATLDLVPEDVRLSPPRLVRWMKERAITQSFIPTPLCEALLREEIPDDMALEVVLTGGDKLHRAPERDPGFRLYNQYGPTENTVVATACRVEADALDDTAPPIGRPIDNVQVYLLDRGGQAVPVGVLGELHIGGKSLARGYHGRPDLTAERFVTSPLDGRTRLYRTGDMVRWRADGQIEFVGRMDGQVKVRGFRIELGEIESVLGQHPAVAECAVLARAGERGDGMLVGYVVLEADADSAAEAPTSESLRAWLRDYLPEYMIPSAVLVLEAMPLTENGKVDRRALPDPDLSTLGEEHVDPTGELEQAIAGVWRGALGLERVGATTNFFDVGGHSLLLAQVHVELQKQVGEGLSIVELFRYPTIASLAAHLSKAGAEAQVGASDDEIEDSRDRGARRRAAVRSRGRARGRPADRGRRDG